MKDEFDGRGLPEQGWSRLTDDHGSMEDGVWRLASSARGGAESVHVDGLEDGVDRLLRHTERRAATSVFLAEDDLALRALLADILRLDGHVVTEADSGSALMVDLAGTFLHGSDSKADVVVISDLRMPGMDGLSVLRDLQRHSWSPPFILMTAFGDPGVHAEARRLGAAAVLNKPIDLGTIRWAVRLLAARPSCR